MLFAGCSCSEETPTDGGLADGALSDGGAPMDDGGDPACGDGVAQGDEVCDDGNTEGGDGCSADCMSDESCGNGVDDEAAGEACDDGNTDDGDGCSADCMSDESCGNGRLDIPAGEVCDDGNEDGGDGCSADCMSNEVCGNGITDEDAGEQCDDSNTVDDDGCDSDCQLENCGDGVVDELEQCDDMNEVDGDGCDTDCSFSCEATADCLAPSMCEVSACDLDTHTCQAATEVDDGTLCDRDTDPDTRDLCLDGECQRSTCGDSFVDTIEDCDDGNDVDGDGCDTDCSYSCEDNADCVDTEICDGTESCDTASHACVAGTPLDDGVDCGGGNVCRSGTCASTDCGDGVVEGVEDCDDENTVEGDGCDNDCTFSCTAAADCTDGRVCNGEETCATDTHTCSTGTTPVDGTLCDLDANPSTRDICDGGVCRLSRCGDSIIDSGTTPAEDCDDGNSNPGDGCENDCTFSCTETADCTDGDPCNGSETCNVGTHTCVAGTPLSDGTLCDADGSASTRDLCVDESCALSECGDGYVDTGASPVEVCDDGNMVSGDGCEADCSVTPALPTAYRVVSAVLVDPHVRAEAGICGIFSDCMDVTSNVNDPLDASVDDFSFNLVQVFRPLDLGSTSNAIELHSDPSCMADSDGDGIDECTEGLESFSSVATNRLAAGTDCDVIEPMSTNGAYTAPNVPDAACYDTPGDSVTLDIAGCAVTLIDARLAAEYNNTVSPTQLLNGVMMGFLTEEAAMACSITNSLICPNTQTLYQILDASDGCGTAADRDMNGSQAGWWFYLNVTAELVEWADTP